MRVNVFFYGLFMDISLLHSKGVNPQDIMLVELKGYSLKIGNRATLIPDTNKTVYGFLMSLTHDEIDTLYSDKSLKAYRYEPVIVYDKNGKMFPAVCFNLVEAPAIDEHNEEYAQKLKLVALQYGLPKEYVNSIS
ncbi:MAG: gamma-glutamylcyclotransferase [Chitinophagaceae bacterium]|nr:gamma-glutamylcyclotransferase [Chitinophagaceae bacterium]